MENEIQKAVTTITNEILLYNHRSQQAKDELEAKWNVMMREMNAMNRLLRDNYLIPKISLGIRIFHLASSGLSNLDPKEVVHNTQGQVYSS
jgi:hypothetical protein